MGGIKVRDGGSIDRSIHPSIHCPTPSTDQPITPIPPTNPQLVTLYCLSMENWSRPPGEVAVILGCVEASLQANIAWAHAHRVRLAVVGQRSRLPDSLQRLIARAEAETGGYEGFTVCLALSYGGRDDIVQAARQLAAEAAKGEIKAEEIDEALFARRLQTGALLLEGGEEKDKEGVAVGPPDLVVRTSGERRLSNFMLFEGAYAELYVADALWPDFGPEALVAAVWDYARRQRRYGGVDGGVGGGDGDKEGVGGGGASSKEREGRRPWWWLPPLGRRREA
jgi:undecaprenyl diphosphate synthase